MLTVYLVVMIFGKHHHAGLLSKIYNYFQAFCLYSGRDQLLPSMEEGERLRKYLPKCEIRRFSNNGHFLFLVGDHFPCMKEILSFSALYYALSSY